jgi:hypothetical protein
MFTTVPAQLHFCGIHKSFCLYHITFRDRPAEGAKKVQIRAAAAATGGDTQFCLCGLQNQFLDGKALVRASFADDMSVLLLTV